MTRLRDDVRTAFEREQTALGDVADARHRLLHSALAERDQPASRGLQWPAAVAAVLIAGIVIATFAIAKANNHSRVVPAATPSASPSPSPVVSPTPLANQLVVPAGTPVILYHDPADFDQLDGVTWDGKNSGKLGTGVTNGGNASPDGSKFTTLGDKSLAGVFWADDSVHYCVVVRTGSSDVTGPGTLQIGAQGAQPRNVARVGTIGASGLNAGGPVVIACSPSADRAIVYQAGGQGVGVQEFWVIQLSTGRTLWHGGGGAWITASHDGDYVALSPAPGQPTKIYGADGKQVAELPQQVFAFSWDGSLVVVAGSFGSTPSVVDWRSGQTIWTCPNRALNYWQSFAEPGGTRLAIGVTDPAYKNTTGFQPVDLFVVGADGVVVFEKRDVTLFG